MKTKHKNQGFSLVELIIAIAILAIVSLPLIMYFTQALNTSEKSKRQQKAQLAAESVQEELKSYSSYAQVASLAAIGSNGWTELSGSEAKIKYAQKKVTVDGTDFCAKVIYDYDSYYMPSSSEIKYNSYEMPKLSSLYSENNIVANENDERDVAVNNLYLKFFSSNPGLTKLTVQSALSGKTTYISIAKESETVVRIKLYSVYACTISGVTQQYEALPIVNSTMARTDLKNIYFLFSAASLSDSINVNIDPSLTDILSNTSIYCICQADGMPSNPSAYRLNVSGNGSACNYYTNNIVLQGSLSSHIDYVTKEQQNRVAKVTVEIFPKDETTFDDVNRIVSLESTMGE